jgi:RNA 2',3'-cyclic 3'-phosphodiesterase
MRCFIAAWPNQPTRLALSSVLDDVSRRVEHRRVSRLDDLHLTLAFIGELADDIAFDLSDEIANLRFRPFIWHLDTLGFFQDAGVVWIGSTPESTKPLATLAGRVRAILDLMSIAHDERPLAPHVTLLRGVKNFVAEKTAPISWRLDSIALYRSAPARQASQYARVER